MEGQWAGLFFATGHVCREFFADAAIRSGFGFGLSYLIASAVTIDVVVIYLCGILKGFKRGILFGGILAALYGALYVLLQSEDYALLAGSSLLFGLVALVMILTRKLDWYALTNRQGP